MPRSRNIKPSFFTNDELAEIDPIGRLLFIGLWTLADYKGELEYREKKIKAQLLPYDDCDIKKIAINLDKSGFIRFYSDGDKVYINIVNFNKHQNPHKNEREKGSEIPSYSKNMRQLIDLKGLTINRDKSRSNHDENETNPADSCSLIPDSCSLIPDSPKSKKFNFKKELLSLGANEQYLNDWLVVRATGKKSANTETALAKFLSEVDKSGLTLNQVLEICAANSWKGFKASWDYDGKPTNGYSQTTQQNIDNLRDW